MNDAVHRRMWEVQNNARSRVFLALSQMVLQCAQHQFSSGPPAITLEWLHEDIQDAVADAATTPQKPTTHGA